MRIPDLLKAIRAELIRNGIEPVYLRRLSALDGREGIVVKPGTLRVLAAYINGSSDVELPVRIIVKRRSAARAMADAEDAADAADALNLLTLDAGEPVTIQCDSDRAKELELSDADWSIWEADASATYHIEPKEQAL